MAPRYISSCKQLGLSLFKEYISVGSLGVRSGRNRGAGCQCGDPTFCPLSVFCPLFDHLLSTYCPQFALVLSLSSLCLLFIHQIPTFVYPSSSFCPPCPLFGLTLSTLLTQILEKSTGQKLVKKWTHFLVNLPPGHPVTGQNLDSFKTLINPKFVHLLPRYHIGLGYGSGGQSWDKFWTKT